MSELILDIETTGLDPFKDRIVCIGCQIEGKQTIFCEGEEDETLKKFWEFMYDEDVHVLIGFNIKFDLRFLVLRSLKHKVRGCLPLPAWDRVLDLQRLLNFNERKSGTLTEFAALVVPDYLEDGKDGEKVPKLFFEGKLDEIKKMNARDLRATSDLYTALCELGFLR